MCERPISSRPRRLAGWRDPRGGRKVHSLVDKVYQKKNLVLAWERVKRNRGAGGVDGQSLAEVEGKREENRSRLQEERRHDTYRPLPVREHLIPKAGQPGKTRKLGIPTICDRVCQQALVNRLDPIFEPVLAPVLAGDR